MFVLFKIISLLIIESYILLFFATNENIYTGNNVTYNIIWRKTHLEFPTGLSFMTFFIPTIRVNKDLLQSVLDKSEL